MPKTRRKKIDSPITHVVNKLKRSKKNDLELENEKPRTDFDHDSLNQSNPITPTPNLLRTPSPEVSSLTIFEEPNEKECSLETTPKKSRSNLSHRYSHRLGVNSRDSIFYQSRICGVNPLYYNENEELNKELSIINQNISYLKEPKIFSNSKRVVENLENVKLSKEQNDIDSIFETPKIKFDSLYNEKKTHQVHNDGIMELKPVLGKKTISRSKSENEIIHLRGMININPYINYDIIQMKNLKENTVNELSFFTPELMKSKPASTPIHNNLETKLLRKPLRDINNDSINLSTIGRTHRKNSFVNRPSLTPFLDKERPSKVQIIKKRVEVTEKKPCRILSRTAPVGKMKSPRKVVHYAKGPLRLHTNYMSCSYKSLIDESKSSAKDDTLGALRKILKRVHRYGAVTAKWTLSLFSVCTRLGYTLKAGISTFCANCEKNEDPKKICNCNQYQEEIGKLTTKIKDLSTDLVDLKSQLLGNIQNNKKIETLATSLEKMSRDIEALKLLKEEMNSLKQQFGNFNTPSSVTSQIAIPPAAPPPPPPPLPPPFPPPGASSQVQKILGPTKKTSKKCKNKDETPRPAISLEDILKVKLKKTSERQAPTRRMNTNQPEISQEMLQQVKLRKPISRPMTPSSLPEISSDGSTSPHSSLKRLLRDDSSFKIKRLRRVGGYSFDDIHKKNLSRLNRERD